MTPVISPWVFYLMPVCEKVSFTAAVFFFILFVPLVLMICCYIFDYDDFGKEELRILKGGITLVTVLIIVTGLLSCLLPGEETILKMIIAQNVTVERVEAATDIVTTVYNDIMNLFGAANG